jgi:hypothetical protein
LSNPAASPTGDAKSIPATRVFSEAGKRAASLTGMKRSAAIVAR